jgi:hypothetical protein
LLEDLDSQVENAFIVSANVGPFMAVLFGVIISAQTLSVGLVAEFFHTIAVFFSWV